MRENENIEIKRIIDILISKKIIIGCILIICILIGCFYTYNYIIPKYKSTTTLLLMPNNSSENKTITSSDLTLNSELIATYSNIAKKSTVLSQVIKNLGLNITEEQLLNKIQVTTITDTYIIEISTTDTDPQKAMDITKELANVFLNEIKQIYNLDNIGIIDEAQKQETPYNINHAKDIILFFVVGLFISGAYVMVIYIFDNTIKKESEVEKYIKVKSLGIVPIYENKSQKANAKSYVTECINSIRTNILYMTSSKETKTILFTSCSPKEGKSWIATNVATSFAEIDKRVLLIDGDMRSGKISKIFKLDNVDGLSNYLYYMTGNVKKDVELAKTFIKETKVPNLHILASGTLPPNPSDLIDSDNMKELLAILKNIYDIIIIDAPPCKVVTDSIILSTIVDSTVLVLSANQTKVNDLTEVKKSIKTVGGEIIGTILNRVEVKPKAYSSSYYYTNGNGKSNKEVKNKRIITVEETVELAKIALKRKDYDISKEMVSNAIENKEQELDGVKEIKDSSTSLEITDNLLHMYEIIEKQNRKLNQVIDSISSIKTQLNTEENIEEQLRQEQEQNKRLEQEINKMMLK